MTATSWSNQDSHRANAEGWDIFHASSGEMRLERDDEAAIFDDDADAWRHVMRKANEEQSAFHVHAMEYLKTASPGEYALIIKDWETHLAGRRA